jgi:DNA-binding LacI/PurR family transcriptional regulator
MAVAMLLENIDNNNQPVKNISFEGELVLRASTAERNV